MLKRTKKAYYLVSAVSFTAALPFAAAALSFGNPIAALTFLGIAIMFAFLQTGPLNAAIVNLTDIKIRSMAFAVNIFIIHALGDAISPAFVGAVSDTLGLRTAVLSTMLFVLPAALFCLAAAKADKSGQSQA